MNKRIRLAVLGVPHDYKSSLIPLIIHTVGYSIEWTVISKCDLLIIGPFVPKPAKRHRWLPRVLRPVLESLESYIALRRQRPLTLFHTAENIRHDEVIAEYSISYDLGVNKKNHFRFPYWMEFLDWAHEGVVGNTSPRFGALLKIARLMSPMGGEFLKKPRRAALFSSHLREPRRLLYERLACVMEVEGFGPYFDSSISNHHSSKFFKKDVLKHFAFNLCPENGIYPGYFTEKIPEAFAADSLPITWVDSNVVADFNPKSFINMQQYAWQDFVPVLDLVNDERQLQRFADEPLLRNEPTLANVKRYLEDILAQATS
jgi:Glycosyltransferase family 10 (fucosyltransferase) C-term